jgi:hypothetical protein
MKRVGLCVVASAMLAGVVAFITTTSIHADNDAAPIFGVTIPMGYRDWQQISVTQEEGDFNQGFDWVARQA